MKIRHTVIFTFYKSITNEQKQEVISRLDEMGRWLTDNLGVTGWIVSEHIPETFKRGGLICCKMAFSLTSTP
jgi:hypothetical protein